MRQLQVRSNYTACAEFVACLPHPACDVSSSPCLPSGGAAVCVVPPPAPPAAQPVLSPAAKVPSESCCPPPHLELRVVHGGGGDVLQADPVGLEPALQLASAAAVHMALWRRVGDKQPAGGGRSSHQAMREWAAATFHYRLQGQQAASLSALGLSQEMRIPPQCCQFSQAADCRMAPLPDHPCF